MNQFEYNEMNYSLVGDEKPNLNSRIKRTGVTETEFSIREFMGENHDLKKGLKEQEGKKKLAELYIDRVSNEFPELVAMLEGLEGTNLKSAVIYLTQKEQLKACNEIIPEYEEAIKKNEQDISAISALLGIDHDTNEFDIVGQKPETPNDNQEQDQGE